MQAAGDGAELGVAGGQLRQDQLARRPSCQRRSDRDEGVQAGSRARHEHDRARRDRYGGRALLRRELQRRILSEDGPLELLQRRARLDPQLLDERAARRAVRVERFGLPTGAVQREHELAPQALAQRMLRDERLELAYELRMAPEREICLDP